MMTVGEETADNVQAVDNAIAAWRYHLPAEKATYIDNLGIFDQMIKGTWGEPKAWIN
jgi:hypothetical protein